MSLSRFFYEPFYSLSDFDRRKNRSTLYPYMVRRPFRRILPALERLFDLEPILLATESGDASASLSDEEDVV